MRRIFLTKESEQYCLYVESKKYDRLVNITKKKHTHRYREQTSDYQSGEERREGQHRGRG